MVDFFVKLLFFFFYLELWSSMTATTAERSVSFETEYRLNTGADPDRFPLFYVKRSDI